MRRAVEIDPAIVVGAPGELPRIALGGPLDQHALPAADHALRDGARLRIQALLQKLEPLLLDLVRHLIGQRGGRRAGPAAVDEAERLVETHVGDEIHGRHEILVASRPESPR